MTSSKPKPREEGWEENFEKRFPELWGSNDGREGYDCFVKDDVKSFIRSLLSRREREVRGVEKKYHELILAVGNKFEGETRHQTALRYIREAEKSIETASCRGQEKIKDQAIEAVKGEK